MNLILLFLVKIFCHDGRALGEKMARNVNRRIQIAARVAAQVDDEFF